MVILLLLCIPVVLILTTPVRPKFKGKKPKITKVKHRGPLGRKRLDFTEARSVLRDDKPQVGILLLGFSMAECFLTLWVLLES